MRDRKLSEPDAYPVILRVGVVCEALMSMDTIIPVINEGGIVRE